MAFWLPGNQKTIVGVFFVFSGSFDCHTSFYISLTLTFQDVKITKPAKNRMQNLGYYIFIVFGIWLLIISIFLFRIIALFNKLTKGVEVTDLKKVLEKVLAEGEVTSKKIDEIVKRIDYLEEDGKLHVQRVGLVRFNPFKELGGDHSFSLAILDAQDSGIVITSLHTRDRTRVYMKDIVKGKSGTELSAEEKRALSNAQKRR